MPTITLRLNDASIAEAIREVETYGNDLPQKAEEIRKRVAQLLETMVQEGFNGAGYDDVVYGGMSVPNVSVDTKTDGTVTLVIAHGKEAVFIEFGAGVYHNPGGAPHPGRTGNIVAIGEYGHGRGKRKVWGYYADPNDKDSLVLTHGTPASMPMYHAAVEVAKMVTDIARDVFKGGGGG